MNKDNDPNRFAAIVALSMIVIFIYVSVYCMIKEIFDALAK